MNAASPKYSTGTEVVGASVTAGVTTGATTSGTASMAAGVGLAGTRSTADLPALLRELTATPTHPSQASHSGRRGAGAEASSGVENRRPVWFMRQAGRSLPEYRALREAAGVGMLEACLIPELAAEITLQPVRRHGVDAAVFFSDIMVPLRLAGVDVHIEPGVGPVMGAPLRSRAEIEALTCRAPEFTADAAASLTRAVQLVVAELGRPTFPPNVPEEGRVCQSFQHSRGGTSTLGGEVAHSGARGARVVSPLGRELEDRELAGLAHSRGAAGWTPVIGFGGAPFTLAAYLVEGKPSRDHLAARTLMHADPEAWDALMRWCAGVTGWFMALQVEAGASAAQLFDSWAGSLSPRDYRERVAPYSAMALEVARAAVSPTTGGRVPLIHFGTGTARILGDMLAAGADAVGVDDRTELNWAISELGGACPVQGNIDPALLGAPWEVLGAAIDECLAAGSAAPGHVVNLGHGVPPGTDPGVLTRVVARVHGDAAWERVACEPWEGPTDAAR